MEFTTAHFWKETLERAVKTFAQGALAVVGVEAVAVQDVNWVSVFAVAATAAIISVLTSVASSGIGERNTPSVVTDKKENEGVPSYTPVTGDANAIVGPNFDSSYRVPSNPDEVLG